MEEKLAQMLQQTVESYKNVRLDTQEQINDWSLWYAHWLLMLTDIRDILGVDPEEEVLAKLLRKCDSTYNRTPTTFSWSIFVAKQIMALIERRAARRAQLPA